MQDIPVVDIRPRSRSIESLDGSCAVSASGACASATPEGRVASFADRGVKRLRVIPRVQSRWDQSWQQMNIVLIDHPSEFPEDDRDHMSDTQSVDSRGGHSDFEGDPESELPSARSSTCHHRSSGESFSQFRVVGIRRFGIRFQPARLCHESSSRFHEGSVPFRHEHADVTRMTLLIVSPIAPVQASSGWQDSKGAVTPAF